MDTGRETPLEWNTSEISASTSVFDITQNQSEELNYTIMSELTFGSNPNRASSSTVPSQESIIADTLAAWEHEEFAPENVTTSGKIPKKRASTSKGTKRKQRKSTLPNESFLSGASENSIDYSAIQSAVLLPNASSQTENNFNNQVSISSHNNTSFNNETSLMNQSSIKPNYPGGIEKTCMCQSSFSSTGSGDSSQLNSTYITSQNSSLVSNSSSNQTIGEPGASFITSTQKARKAGNISLPIISQDKSKILNVPPPKDVKKRVARGQTKTKTKGTQVNIKTKAPNKKAAPKKTTAKRAVGKKMQENKNEKQEKKTESNNTEGYQPENDLNVNLGNPSDYEIKEKLLKEKVEELLNMPSTSQAVPRINNSIVAVNDIIDSINDNTMSSVDPDQSGSEVLVSQSCSIEIIKDANRASKINIILPPETNLSLSKKNTAPVKPNRNSSSNKVKKPSVTAESNDTPKQGKVKIKQEKPSPKSIDLTSEAESIDKKHEKKRHSRKSVNHKHGNTKHREASPAPKPKKQTIACGYMSSGSSDDQSFDSLDFNSSSTCSCTDCESYCNSCDVSSYSSCSCSSYSESSYESPHTRKHRR